MKQHIWIGHMLDLKYEMITTGNTKKECREQLKTKWNEDNIRHQSWDEFTENNNGTPPDEYYATWYNRFEIGKTHYYGVTDDA